MRFRTARSTVVLNTLLIAVFFYSAGQCGAQMANTQKPQRYVPWVSYETAVEQNAINDRPVMILFNGSDWSPESREFMIDILTTHEFAGWSSRHVIKVEVDFPKHRAMEAAQRAQNEQLRLKYQTWVEAVPTVLFIDSTGHVIGKLEYRRGTAEDWLRRASEIIHNRPVPDLVA